MHSPNTIQLRRMPGKGGFNEACRELPALSDAASSNQHSEQMIKSYCVSVLPLGNEGNI